MRTQLVEEHVGSVLVRTVRNRYVERRCRALTSRTNHALILSVLILLLYHLSRLMLHQLDCVAELRENILRFLNLLLPACLADRVVPMRFLVGRVTYFADLVQRYLVP